MMKSMIFMILIIMMSMSIMMLLAMSFMSNNKSTHPILMGLILFITSILSSMNLSIYHNSHWYSFILFLIIVGGLMIIFLYFTSFISNMKTSIKWNFMKMIPMKIIIILMFTILMLINYKINLSWYNTFNEINSLSYMMSKNNMMLMNLYSFPKNMITMMSMIYLLLVLTLIVKMCLSKKFSLRKMN